ncbi:hypothetical protein H0H92_012602 [Tricholoma furcatifolium]|nr:hypothetical protein H0H92_012602 [Tricholoma furcatifolium]
MSVEENRTYVLVNAKSRTVLDLSGTDNFTISGWEVNGGQNQQASQYRVTQWYLTRDNNQWVFRNVGNNKYLGLAVDHSGRVRDDTPVVAVDHPVPWDIFPDARNGQNHRIFAVNTRFNIDLAGFGDRANGTRVSVWGEAEQNENQTWHFQQADDDNDIV